MATGQFCRLTDISMLPGSTQAAGTQGMVCDQPTATTATVMTYTGSGLAYNGTPLVAIGGPLSPLVLTNGTAPTDILTFPLAPPGECRCELRPQGSLASCTDYIPVSF